ncbi:MAG: transglutaminase family protein [Rhodobacterales bacterium]|nr:transglutaminase family protein [Rhodobacterales bacterium]
MRLRISHSTRYVYDQPVPYALQQLRLTPKSHGAQSVIRWTTMVEGGKKELTFEDSHRNTVDLISFDAGTQAVTVTCAGEVEVRETHGVVGQHAGYMPVWMFERVTALTKPGAATRKLAQTVGGEANVLKRMHDLMALTGEVVKYTPGRSHVKSTAEEALAAGFGVCQDQAHVFIAAARAMGVPARYVSGYLMMNDRVDQDATHAWAEACIPNLGWVGFDVANSISPDTRYVRVATGLDYAEAAPVSGMRLGSGAEVLTVTVAVQQQ